MLTISRLLTGFLTVIILIGCAAHLEAAAGTAQSQTSHDLQGSQDKSLPPAGYADVVVQASRKTHLQGYYPLESKSSPHGQATYTFVVNIDGQAQTYVVQGRQENGPEVDDQGRTSAEKGVGMQYVLEQKFRLPAGRHRISLELPGDQVVKETEVTLEDGKSYVLKFQPHYRRYKWGREAFENWLSGYAVHLEKISGT
jgi:hypothetical protein